MFPRENLRSYQTPDKALDISVHLSYVAKTRPASRFSRVLTIAKADISSLFEAAYPRRLPPIFPSTIPIVWEIPRVVKGLLCEPSIF